MGPAFLFSPFSGYTTPMERKNPFHPLDFAGLPSEGNAPLEVGVLRGSSVESRHRVHVVESDAAGNLLRHWGNPELSFFPRSAVKMIQALVWMEEKSDPEEIAIACGSHHGEEIHLAVVNRWLGRLGLSEKNLECGAHEPTGKMAALALARKGESPCQIHNNCSGKHCGLLTACLASGWDLEGYSNYDHPLQAKIRELLAQFLGMDLNQSPWGIDGCGIPTYAIPLRSMAVAMAKLANPDSLDSHIQKSVGRVNAAIKKHPLLLGGSESFSSKVVAETEGRAYAKLGAEGVYGIWLPQEGIGLSVKCEDGNARAAECAVAAILRDLGHPVSFSPLLKRWTGEVVGQLLLN